ncbi:MAG TPA: hypothetical protein VLF14_06265 [Candidatus Binatia bacterium]|nr:hypothetical protein [Candidatus Binatia bacterium]
MADRLEVAIVGLVLAAAGLVLLAPLLGRYGAPGVADVAVGGATAAGIGAFFATAYNTLRAARKGRRADRGRDLR